MKTKTTKSALKPVIVERGLIVGPITLSNGSKSDHYFDCKRVTLTSEGASLVGDAFLDAILQLSELPVAIGGLTHGADPIIGAVMMKAKERGIGIDGFYVRQEPKNHGTKKLIENQPSPGSAVVIVDDVVTAGGSILKGIAGAKAAGCRVLAAMTLVDRLEGGSEKIRNEVSNYVALYTLDDFRSDIERLKCQQHTQKSEPLLPVGSR